jgi:large subunit ribosomal protein L6
MSRIGRNPVPIPGKVKVEVKGDIVTVASPDGKKSLTQQVSMVQVKVVDNQVVLEALEESRDARSRHGLYRTLIANMILGVTTGWEKRLEIHGAGYKVEKKGKQLVLTVGYTYPREYSIPQGIDIELPDATSIVVRGTDKALVGQTAASLRSIRPPDPYRGKGIRLKGEHAVRKVAKGK